MPNQNPAAVLFDFDGTLVDTEPYWARGRIEHLTALGAPFTMEQSILLRGASVEDSQAAMMAHMTAHGIDVDAMDIVEFYAGLCTRIRDLIEQNGAPWLPGALDLLTDLKANSVPCAVVSSSPPDVLAAGLREFPPDVISVVIDGTMVTRRKPDPEGFKMAAQMLGVESGDCVVIEDNKAGATAGLTAGAVVIVIPDCHDIPAAPKQVIIPTLEGVDTTRLFELYRQGLAS